MSELQVTARWRIHDRKLDEFKELAEQCMESVRTKDTGTLQYDWFFSGDHTECVVRETYRDSEAALEHMTNLGGELAAALTAVADLEAEFFGAPSDELLEAMAALRPRVYSAYQSI